MCVRARVHECVAPSQLLYTSFRCVWHISATVSLRCSVHLWKRQRARSWHPKGKKKKAQAVLKVKDGVASKKKLPTVIKQRETAANRAKLVQPLP